jgi:predicted amidohydrolase
MVRPLNIACLQTRPRPDFQSALTEALKQAETAVGLGAELITLPEYCGGLRTEGAAFSPPATSEETHPVLAGLRDFARTRKVWLVIGSLAITGPEGKIKNRGFVIDDVGDIRSHYDKIHLFDIDLSKDESYRESALVSGGRQAVLVDTPFGVMGHTICYDLRFPDLYRDLAQAGAEILLVPAAFTKKTGEAHWHVLNRARAIENGAFLVAPCAVGPVEGGGESYGHSLIVSPWGEVLADGGDQPGVAQATIDLEQVAATRRRIPSLSNDQPYSLSTSHGRDVA